VADIGAVVQGTSGYAYSAYIDADQCYVYANAAYVDGTGSYKTISNACTSFSYAYYAYYDNAIGLNAAAENSAYAYYYGSVAPSSAYSDYAASGGTSQNSCNAFFYGYFDWSYSENVALGQ
jgi:hypothetical protein